jgi:uncharacterized DUF497 family protein
MRLIWDESKRNTNLAKHGLDFAELSLDFFSDALVTSARSKRYKAIGWHGDLLIIAVVFAPLGAEAISVISMRPASQKERAAYAG